MIVVEVRSMIVVVGTTPEVAFSHVEGSTITTTKIIVVVLIIIEVISLVFKLVVTLPEIRRPAYIVILIIVKSTTSTSIMVGVWSLGPMVPTRPWSIHILRWESKLFALFDPDRLSK